MTKTVLLFVALAVTMQAGVLRSLSYPFRVSPVKLFTQPVRIVTYPVFHPVKTLRPLVFPILHPKRFWVKNEPTIPFGFVCSGGCQAGTFVWPPSPSTSGSVAGSSDDLVVGCQCYITTPTLTSLVLLSESDGPTRNVWPQPTPSTTGSVGGSNSDDYDEFGAYRHLRGEPCL